MAKRISKKKRHNIVLISITTITVLTYLATTFYIDSANWCKHDLFWQIPVWIICYTWVIIFSMANDWFSPRKRKHNGR